MKTLVGLAFALALGCGSVASAGDAVGRMVVEPSFKNESTSPVWVTFYTSSEYFARYEIVNKGCVATGETAHSYHPDVNAKIKVEALTGHGRLCNTHVFWTKELSTQGHHQPPTIDKPLAVFNGNSDGTFSLGWRNR